MQNKHTWQCRPIAAFVLTLVEIISPVLFNNTGRWLHYASAIEQPNFISFVAFPGTVNIFVGLLLCWYVWCPQVRQRQGQRKGQNGAAVSREEHWTTHWTAFQLRNDTLVYCTLESCKVTDQTKCCTSTVKQVLSIMKINYTWCFFISKALSIRTDSIFWKGKVSRLLSPSQLKRALNF